MPMLDLTKAKKVVHARLIVQGQSDLTARDVAEAREYIRNWWPQVTRYHPDDDASLVGLPKPYIVPSYTEEGFDYDELYYWDSYFICQGLLGAEHEELVKGILKDLLELLKRYKVIPNGSRTYLMGRSQPPFLSSLIMDIYNAYKPGADWLKSAMALAQQEYKTVWMGNKKPNDRQALPHDGVEQRAGLLITCGIGICPGSQKRLHSIRIAPSAHRVKHGIPEVISLVD